MRSLHLFVVISLFSLLFCTGWGIGGGGGASIPQVTGLSGIVMDVNGKFLEGAVVTVSGTKEQEVTDGTGLFSFSGIKPGVYDLTAEKEGYATQTKRVHVKQAEGRHVSFILTYVGQSQGLPQVPLAPGAPSGTVSIKPYDQALARVYVAFAAPPVIPGGGGSSMASPGGSGPTSFGEMVGVMYGADPMGGGIPHSAGGSPTAVVQGLGSNLLAIMDVTSNQIVASLPLGSRPYWLAIHPRGTFLYVADETRRISIFSPLQQNTYLTSLGFGDALVSDLTFSPQGDKLYVALKAGLPQVAVIETYTNTLIGSIPVPRMKNGDPGQPGGIAATLAGKLAVTLGTTTSGELVVVDGNSKRLEGSVPVGSLPLGVAATPDGSRAVVANYGSATVSVVDLLTPSLLATIRVGVQPTKVAMRPDGRVAFVTNNGSGTISVIDVLAAQAIGTVNVGQGPMGIAVSQDGTRVYVANNGAGNVTVVDGLTFGVVATTPPARGSMPYGIVIRP